MLPSGSRGAEGAAERAFRNRVRLAAKQGLGVPAAQRGSCRDAEGAGCASSPQEHRSAFPRAPPSPREAPCPLLQMCRFPCLLSTAAPANNSETSRPCILAESGDKNLQREIQESQRGKKAGRIFRGGSFKSSDPIKSQSLKTIPNKLAFFFLELLKTSPLDKNIPIKSRLS